MINAVLEDRLGELKKEIAELRTERECRIEGECRGQHLRSFAYFQKTKEEDCDETSEEVNAPVPTDTNVKRGSFNISYSKRIFHMHVEFVSCLTAHAQCTISRTRTLLRHLGGCQSLLGISTLQILGLVMLPTYPKDYGCKKRDKIFSIFLVVM